MILATILILAVPQETCGRNGYKYEETAFAKY